MRPPPRPEDYSLDRAISYLLDFAQRFRVARDAAQEAAFEWLYGDSREKRDGERAHEHSVHQERRT